MIKDLALPQCLKDELIKRYKACNFHQGLYAIVPDGPLVRYTIKKNSWLYHKLVAFGIWDKYFIYVPFSKKVLINILKNQFSYFATIDVDILSSVIESNCNKILKHYY